MTIQSLDSLIEQIAQENHKALSSVLSGSTPQRLLRLKLLIQKLDSRADKTALPLFTEEIVNRLMHLAFLTGRAEGNDDGYLQGWNDCRESVMTWLKGRE